MTFEVKMEGSNGWWKVCKACRQFPFFWGDGSRDSERLLWYPEERIYSSWYTIDQACFVHIVLWQRKVLSWSFCSIFIAVRWFYSRSIFLIFFIPVHVHIAIEVGPVMIILILSKLRTFPTFLVECLSPSICSSILLQEILFHLTFVISWCWVRLT